MKKIVSVILLAAVMTFSLALFSYAATEEGQQQGFFQKLGDNIWYIVLVIAFGAGLIVINKWSAKIKARDEKTKQEYEEWKEEDPERAERFEKKLTGEALPPESDDESAEEIEKDAEKSAEAAPSLSEQTEEEQPKEKV